MKKVGKRLVAALVGAATVAAGAVPAQGIIGGQDATTAYPGIVYLEGVIPGLGVGKCTATLTEHPRFILTAAHCVSDDTKWPAAVPIPAEGVTARIGSNDRTTPAAVATGVRVYLHPDWQWEAADGVPGARTSDLALVELDREVRLPGMPLAARPAPDQVRIIGFGLTSWPVPGGTALPTRLQQLDTTVLPPEACAAGFPDSGELCIGHADGSAGACFGDSGGPALRRLPSHTTRWAQVGITSREGTAQPCNGPALFTDVTDLRFRLWIYTTILTRRATPPNSAPPSPLHTTLTRGKWL